MSDKIDYVLELNQIRETLGYDFLSLALAYDGVLRWRYASGNINEGYKRIVLHSGRGIAEVFRTGRSILIPSFDEYLQPGELFNYPISRMENLKSIGVVPVWNDLRVAGVLLGGFRGKERVTPEMLYALEQVSNKGIGEFNGKNLV
ncbi:GAF domain-containing protein [Paenibacillus sp. MMS20-IR301]|uniref:GAF domain-containing protein n=1 Tax=Paenibacillus sp. MMS20-IR301 TaxID=2895946 RepID=UPI0028F021EA|nr:GAF domain-containing protein [Paenibacillus sp. MMS20-IR301]WNS45359.1 GAF domain-containing protein [Paenibacillus sp. MMS20-IR301]